MNKLISGWVNVSRQISVEGLQTLALFKPVAQKPTASQEAFLSLRIADDFSWKLLLSGRHIPFTDCPLLETLPSVLCSVAKVDEVVRCLDSCKICIGNNEEDFLTLARQRKGTFKNQSGN